MKNYLMSLNTVPYHAGLLLLLVLIYAGACSTSPRTGANAGGATASDGPPEITDEKIRQNINGRRVEEVPEESNATPPINWTFLPEEPKEFTVLEKQMNGDTGTFIIDMKTRSADGSRNPRHLAGKIKLHYELQTDLVFRRWVIVDVENISMKYKNEPQKEQNSNENDDDDSDDNDR